MIYAIGDIHGCYDRLQLLLAKIRAHARGRPFTGIFLGDYIDRGPHARDVVNYVRRLVTSPGEAAWIALKGNHEDMLASNIDNAEGQKLWKRLGGDQTLRSYRGRLPELKQDSRWLGSLPTMHETAHHVFVHAGLSTAYSLADQPDGVKLWIRNWQRDDPDFGKHVVYGHSPSKTPLLLNHSSGLDTGVFDYGVLTCGVFDETRPGGPVDLIQSA